MAKTLENGRESVGNMEAEKMPARQWAWNNGISHTYYGNQLATRTVTVYNNMFMM